MHFIVSHLKSSFQSMQQINSKQITNHMPRGVWYVSHIQYPKYLQRDMWLTTFKEALFPLPCLQQCSHMRGWHSSQKNLPLSFCHSSCSYDNPHPGCQPHRLLARPESSLSQCSLPPRHWSSGLVSTLVLRDTSGIQGMRIIWVIILTVSLINLVLGQDPLIPTNHSSTI